MNILLRVCQQHGRDQRSNDGYHKLAIARGHTNSSPAPVATTTTANPQSATGNNRGISEHARFVGVVNGRFEI